MVQQMNTSFSHIPVMSSEVIDILRPEQGKTYIDATFGGGGYSQKLLNAAPCFVWGVDRDPEAVDRGKKFEKIYPNFKMLHGEFGNLQNLLFEPVDGIVFDLGVSSYQLEQANRGFSFQHEGPLDMRMDPNTGISAANIVNHFSGEDLADIIYYYGEERYARRVARAIIAYRQDRPFVTTHELATIIRRVVPRDPSGIDTATRTFQGLRIFVNDELNQLRQGIDAAISLLVGGGKIVVVSFHSLEDREVKNIFQGINTTSRYGPPSDTKGCAEKSALRVLNKKVIRPNENEIRMNPRARSAKLRSAEKIGETL